MSTDSAARHDAPRDVVATGKSRKTGFPRHLFFAVAAAFLLPLAASAHQPRLVTTSPVVVVDPEVSKAYYGKLTGEPQVFTIDAAQPFKLYVGVLVPDIPGQKKDVSAAVLSAGDPDHPIAVLDGASSAWKPFHEEFGNDDYFQGPEYRADLGSGQYEIRVWSSNNDSAYSLAVGEEEAFPPSEILNALKVMPAIKEHIFGKPWWTAYTTPFLLPVLLGSIVVLAAAIVVPVIIIRRRKKSAV